MRVDVQVTGLEREQAAPIAAQIDRIVGVRSVLLSEHAPRVAAE